MHAVERLLVLEYDPACFQNRLRNVVVGLVLMAFTNSENNY